MHCRLMYSNVLANSALEESDIKFGSKGTRTGYWDDDMARYIVLVSMA